MVVSLARWDRIKDPLGILDGFLERARPATGAHLLLAGPDPGQVADDPEAEAVLAGVRGRWRRLPPRARGRGHVACFPLTPAGGEHREGERDPAAGRGGGQEEPAGGVRPGSDRGDVEGPSRRRERRGGSSGAGPASARRAAGRRPSRYRGVRRCDRGAPARTAAGRPARPGRARTGPRPVPQRPALRALGGGLRLGARAASRSPQINGPRGGRASAPMARRRGARSW